MHPTSGAATERAPSEGARSATRNELICLAVIVLAAAVIRIPQGVSQSLFGDELWAYVSATQSDLSGALDGVRGGEELTPPLFTLLSWTSARLGDPTVLIRLPSMLAGIALIPTIFELGRRAFDSRVGLVAALIATLNPFLIWYSVEARAYSLVALLVALSTLSLLIALEHRELRWWAAYAFFTCAAMYTHYTALFVLVAQLLWVALAERSALKAALASNALAVLVFLPWVPGLREDLDSPFRQSIGFLAPFDFDNVVRFTASWAFGPSVGFHPASLRSFWGTAGILLLAAGFVVAGLALAERYRQTRRLPLLESPRGRYLLLFAMLAVATPVGVAIASAVGDDIFLPRNLIASSPGLTVVMAAVLVGGASPLRWVAVTTVVATFSLGAARSFEARWERPQFEAMAAYLDRNAEPGAVVVSLPGLGVGGEPGGSIPPSRSITIYSGEPHEWAHTVNAGSIPQIRRASRGTSLFLAGDTNSVGLARGALGLDGVEPVAQVDYDGVVPTTILKFDDPGRRMAG